MKIVVANTEGQYIYFDNGYTLSADHEPDCCECNYADFDQINDLARAYDFDVNSIQINKFEGSGFTFGDGYRQFFVPCYSEQNGYYSDDIDITLFDNKSKMIIKVNLECEEVER